MNGHLGKCKLEYCIMDKFEEKRRCERIPLAEGVEVEVNDIAVGTKDITRDGIRVVAKDVDVELGDIVDLTISIELKPNIYLKAEVIRVEKSGFSLKVKKNKTNGQDLARFYELVRKCRKILH